MSIFLFLLVIGVGLAAMGVAVLTVASSGLFPSEAMAGVAGIAVGGIYVVLGAIHMKTKMMGKVIRATSTPLWLYVVGLLIVFALVYYLLGGIEVLSIIGAIISLIITLIVGIIYAFWTIVDRLTKRVTRIPFWFYIVTLIPVLLLTYFLFGALWR